MVTVPHAEPAGFRHGGLAGQDFAEGSERLRVEVPDVRLVELPPVVENGGEISDINQAVHGNPGLFRQLAPADQASVGGRPLGGVEYPDVGRETTRDDRVDPEAEPDEAVPDPVGTTDLGRGTQTALPGVGSPHHGHRPAAGTASEFSPGRCQQPLVAGAAQDRHLVRWVQVQSSVAGGVAAESAPRPPASLLALLHALLRGRHSRVDPPLLRRRPAQISVLAGPRRPSCVRAANCQKDGDRHRHGDDS